MIGGLAYGDSASDGIQNQVVGPFGTLNNYDSSVVIPNDKAQDLLNVDITPGGRSVKKRPGYSTAYTLAITTSPTHGVYRFYDSSGNEVFLFFNDHYLTSSVNGNTPSVLFSTGTNAATYQCVDYAGQAYCSNTNHTNILKTDGATYSSLSGVVSTGTMVAITPDRLAQSGFSEAPNRIDFSASALFTSWAQPFLYATDPNQITITAPGSKITHLVYAFQRLMWFKDSSFGYVFFDNSALSNWQVRTISSNLGTLDNSSIYWQDVLYFRGQDGHFYSYDGSTLQRMSREITNSINQAQSRGSGSWTQTTEGDFESGSVGTGLSTTILPGSVVLTTAAAISSFVDTLKSDFDNGISSNVTHSAFSSSNDSALSLSFSDGSEISKESFSSGAAAEGSFCSNNSGYYLAQSFTATDSYALTSVTLVLGRLGSSQTFHLRILSDSGGVPGTVLSDFTFSSPVDPTTLNIPTTSSLYPELYPHIQSGRRYWIQIYPDASSSCSAKDLYWYAEGGGAFTEFSAFGSSIGHSTQFFYQNYGKHRNSAGNFISQSFDTNTTTSTWIFGWPSFTTTASVPTGCSLTYQTQTNANNANPNAWEALQGVISGSSVTSTAQRYIRYKASFSCSSSDTPILSDVTITNSVRTTPTGTYLSAVNHNDSIIIWDTFNVGYSNGNLSGHSFYVRSSSNSFTINSSTPSWTAISAGAVPTISTGAYFQIRDVFVASVYSNIPQLDSFSLNWLQGLAGDKVYGQYFDYGLWWNVQLGGGSTYNNYVLKYDLINNGWLLYDIPMNGMFVRSNSLYFGSSAGGYIYKYGVSNNDNGSAINAYWKSKDFFGDSPFTQKSFSELSASATSVQNSTATLTLTVDNRYVLSDTWPLYNPYSNFIKYNNCQPLTAIGTTFNFKFGNNAAEQPFEVFAGMVGFRPKPIKDTKQ